MIPPLKDLPVINDSGTSGLRLQATSAKALPPIADVGSGSNSKAREAAEYAAAVGLAFEQTRAINARSKAIRKAKGRILQEQAENFNKRKR